MNKIRYMITALALAAFSAGAWAEKGLCVVIHEAQGTTAFDLSTRPVVSFTDDDVKIESGDVTVLYPLDKYLKLTIEEHDVAVGMKAVATEGFRITDTEIVATGGGSLALYAVDGKRIATAKAADGTAHLSIAALPAGVYIVVTNNQTFKISKK